MNKKFDKGKIVSTFLMGSKRVYDFIDDNPGVAMMDVGYTNDPFIIAQQPKMTAINSALSVDITGQVNADSPAVTNKGVSKITPTLLDGAGVVTTRFDVHYIVTEFGVANLYGKTLQDRAKEIIKIAHPDHREALDQAAFERFGSHYHFIKK